MRQFRNSNIIANEVSMLRASMRGAILLVEGDTDSRLYRRFMMRAPVVRLTHCDGKPTLLEALDLLDDRGIDDVLGICDADYDRVTQAPQRPRLVYADFHDAEMMIVHTKAFRRVHEELYEETMTDKAFQSSRDSLLMVAADIGAVRLWNLENGNRLRFSAVSPGAHLSPSGFSYETYFMKVIEENPTSKVGLADIMNIVSERRKDVADGELASGHDFTSLIDAAAALFADREPYGGRVVEKMLRLAFDVESFEGTALLSDLQKWEDRTGLEILEVGLGA